MYRVMMTNSPSQAIKTSPVTVVRGMTHMQFASGSHSHFIYKYDLEPEKEETDVQGAVSLIVSSFIAGTALRNETSLTHLESAVQDAGKFFQPLVDAYWLEGSYKFKPPCYENTPSPACQVGSWWTRRAMIALSNLKEVQVNDTDSFHPASEVIPTYHHPKIMSQNCPSPDASCTVVLTSVSDIYYKDKDDSGLVPNSACEIRAKLKSRQSVMLAAGFKNVSFNVTDSGSWCKKINQLAYNVSVNELSDPVTKTRFMKYGSPMVMGEDQGCMHNGGLWIYLPMKYSWEDSGGENTLVLRSVQLSTDITYPIGIFAGMHYCKLLSPARVMEWVYVDGLREKNSLSGTAVDMPLCGF